MPLTNVEICTLIPHDGAMCLLDEVLSWDEHGIACVARNHVDSDHPLRHRGMLHAVCGIEYAAQAMAVHGALLAGQSIASGFLAAVRSLKLHVERIDDQGPVLNVVANRLMAGADGLVYEFQITARAGLLLAGRATVALRHGEDRVETSTGHRG